MKGPLTPLLLISLLIAFMVGCGEVVEAETQEPPQLPVEEVNLEEPVIIEDYYPLTDEERELIWQTLYAEVRGCDCENDNCLIYVAQCIRDRVLVKDYGNTVTKVITAKNQFTYYRGKASPELDKRINDAIDLVFKDGYYAFDDPILHFHADYVTPSWADDFKELAYIDGTKFYS